VQGETFEFRVPGSGFRGSGCGVGCARPTVHAPLWTTHSAHPAVSKSGPVLLRKNRCQAVGGRRVGVSGRGSGPPTLTIEAI